VSLKDASRIARTRLTTYRLVGTLRSAASLALHTQAVLQGAFILAKAGGGADIAAASIDHLRRYIELLFRPATFPADRGAVPCKSIGSGRKRLDACSHS